MTFVKIPITLYDKDKTERLGLDDPATLPAIAYIDVTRIESIRQGHDSSLGDDLNTEGSVIEMMSRDSYVVKMSLDELIEYLFPHLKPINDHELTRDETYPL